MLSAIRCFRIPCCSLTKSPPVSVGTVGSASIVAELPSEFGVDCSGVEKYRLSILRQWPFRNWIMHIALLPCPS
jgi:hypothetical protein